MEFWPSQDKICFDVWLRGGQCCSADTMAADCEADLYKIFEWHYNDITELGKVKCPEYANQWRFSGKKSMSGSPCMQLKSTKSKQKKEYEIIKRWHLSLVS